ncbi:MAG: hypothetical protein JXB32_11750 [Deltaproteobacteria bacterium]|nr:hypothetical protein [Deltaproteobacteria bacterium]
MRSIIVLVLVLGCRGQTPAAANADESVRGPDAAPAPRPQDPATPSNDAAPDGSRPEDGSADGERGPDDTTGYFAPPGAPHPHACEVDADCRPGPGVNPEDGCCDTGVSNGVYGQAYLAWRAAWVREHCADAECPVLPPPSPPLPCALEGRCCDGRCRNRCR